MPGSVYRCPAEELFFMPSVNNADFNMAKLVEWLAPGLLRLF